MDDDENEEGPLARRRASELEIDVRDHGRQAREGLQTILHRLASLSCAPHRAVSLYLDTHWRDEQQRDRVRLEVRDRARELAARFPDDRALAADLDAALAFTLDRVVQFEDVGYHGIALFRCAPAGLDLSLRCRAGLPTVVAAGPLPLLRPLAALAHRAPRALLAIVDHQAVRVYEVGLGELSPPSEVTGEVPSAHSSGGWSQLRLQHHRDERIDALHREAAQLLSRRFDEMLPSWVLVGGREGAVANLRRLLPERVLARALELGELDGREPDRELLAQVEARIAVASAIEERELAATIETLARSGGRGAIGLPSVVDALNRGRVMQLLCDERLSGELAVCDTCGVLSLEPGAESCSVCGAPTHTVEAAEAIVRAALPLDAEIGIVRGHSLDRDGGVAASLRF